VKMRHVVLGAAAVLVAGSVALAGGWGAEGKRGMGRGMGGGMGAGMGSCNGPGMMGAGGGALSRLDLTEQQTEQLRALDETFQAEAGPLREELAAKRDEMRALRAGGGVDADTLQEKRQALQALRAELEEKALEHRSNKQGLLTAEQQEKLATLRGGCGMGRGAGCCGAGPQAN
jgi:Spy/CpxP family protein refolding chaperone